MSSLSTNDNVNKEDNNEVINEDNNEDNNELESPPKKQKTQEQLWFVLWRDGEIMIHKLESKDMVDIADLKKAVHKELEPELDDIAAGRLTVYEPQKVDDKAKANFAEGKFGRELDPRDKVPDTCDGELPILVVAPKKTTPDSGPTAPILTPFDIKKIELLPLNMVPICPVLENPPPAFCANREEWISEHVRNILEAANERDTERRVSPTAFVRCSRGGKTRALKEIQKELHSKGISTIFVSFNEFSNVQDSERRDPVGALCRRIVYAAMKGVPLEEKWTKKGFTSRARILGVKPDQVTTWLEGRPCILLIDELNVLLNASVPEDKCKALGAFLTEHFLEAEGRYFVFTSHISTETGALSSFIKEVSARTVKVFRLPTISTVAQAQTNLGSQGLTETKALYYGRIPSLIYLGDTIDPKLGRYTDVLKEFSENCTEESIRKMLYTYITGRVADVPPVLLQLMDVASEQKVVWIFCHMSLVLEEIETIAKGTAELRKNCKVLKDLLEDFKNERPKSGNAWESLFCATLLIRLIAGQYDDVVLPLAREEFVNCKVSFNAHLKEGFTIDNTTSPDALIDNMEYPRTLLYGPNDPKKSIYPHVVVYKPPHAQFQVYDILVAVYKSPESDRKVYGYQLKEGESFPSRLGVPSEKCSQNFLICGDATNKPRNHEKWKKASDAEISAFLGFSGSKVSPKEWKH